MKSSASAVRATRPASRTESGSRTGKRTLSNEKPKTSAASASRARRSKAEDAERTDEIGAADAGAARGRGMPRSGKPRPMSAQAGASLQRGPAPTKDGLGSRAIDQRIRDVGGWRGATLARMRALILEACPDVVEECKWVKPSNPSGVPVWSRDGIICTGEIYTKAVKLTFAHGATLPDPSGLFNSSLDGNTRRAIDISEGEKIDARAFEALVKAAVALNQSSTKKR